MRSNNEENVRTSMEQNVWATQPQNESKLNQAFKVNINLDTKYYKKYIYL